MDSPQQSESPHKLCKTCPRILPATTMYFHRDKYSKDGLCSSCKECKKASRRTYYAQNTEKAKAYSKQYVADNREHTAQYQKHYAEQHQAELTTYKKAYYAEHQEANKVRSRQWYVEHSRENREKRHEQDRKYRQEHLEEKRERDRKYKEDHQTERILQSKQYYAEHREERLSYTKQYYQTERGIIAKRAGAHNRRARRKKAPGSHTTEQLYQQFKKQEGKCFYCQKELRHARNSWHADHVIPLSKGGSNDISNIVISCPTCNRKKHDKLPNEWANELPTHLTERL